MNHTLPKIGFSLLLAAVLFGCKKNSDGGGSDTSFQSFTLKFGSDSTAITIDSATKVLKNMPRNCDVTKLAAAAVLPAGASISPDPATVADYTKGVTYTVKANGKTYTVQITAPVYDPLTNPYGIYTARQLNDLHNGLNDSYVLMNDIELPALTTAGAASVGISDYKDYGWYSIGARYVNGGHVVFGGTIDGQNHVIKNLTSIYRSGSQPSGIDAGRNGKNTDGLFGYAIHATIKNLGIQLAPTGINDVSVTGDALSYVAGLVGYADSSTITNCYVTGNNAVVAGSQYAGGLAGTLQNSTVSKCYAAITAPAGSYAVTSSDAGGLTGTTLFSNISDSWAACSVKGSVSQGGLAGSINGCTVKTCYASGNVTEEPLIGSSSLVPPNNIGGLIGTVSATPTVSSKIQNCYATGAITGANGSNTAFHQGTRIGGLIGNVNTTSGTVTVTNCYAAGAITRPLISSTAPFLTGGLAGNTANGVFITATCTNYWDRTTTGQTNLGGGNSNLAQDNAFTTNGKTTAEMKVTATYTNWDFSSTWNVAGSTNSGYPYLRTTSK